MSRSDGIGESITFPNSNKDADIRRLEKEIKDMDALADECIALNDLALKLEQEGKFNDAIEQYEKCIQKNWDGSLTYARLIKIYMFRFDYKNVSRICDACNKNIKNSQSVSEHNAIINGINEFLSGSVNRFIGQTKPICPCCGANLGNMPEKKLVCSVCQEPIYIKSRPVDGLKVLLTEKEVEQVDEQWTLVKGTHEFHR
jgi:tetratricopeptide (TPR) repeat protein